MVTIQLYDGNIPFNNNDKMSNFASLDAQNNYFNNHANLTLTDDCKFTGYEQPILINLSFDDLISYKYGRITTNNTDWVYFSINRFVIERDNKTWMWIDVDVWETFRYRQHGLSLGRGHVTRCSRSLSTKIKTALRPKFKNTREYDKLRQSSDIEDNYCLIVLIHNSQTNVDYIVVAKPSDRFYLNTIISQSTINYIVNNLGLTGNDVIGAWLSPFSIDTDNTNLTPVNQWTDISPLDGHFSCYWMFYEIFLNNITQGYQLQTIELNKMTTQPDDKTIIGITDLRDNLVWVSDNESYYDTKIKLSFSISYGACGWNGYITKDGTQYLEGLFTIPCEVLDYFNDAFTLYNVQQRPFIEEQRAIQREQALINSFSNIGQSAIMGGIGGNVYGALAGGIVGAIGSGIEYFSSDYYNKEYQLNEDMQAINQSDILKINGLALVDIVQEKTYCQIVTIESDDQTLAEYNTDIATYGNYYDLETDIESMIGTNVKLTVTTNEINNIPSSYVGNVQSRLARGVIFINPT